MKNLFGVLPTGEKVFSYELKDGDYSVKIINYGAIIQSFNCFGTDIVGGFDTLEEYINDGSFQGCIVGRVANRIKDAKFTLDGIEYNLTKNEPQGTLHGGSRLNKKLWSFEDFKENSVTLTVDSPDLEDGFPGNMKITVKYTLKNGALVIDYNAVSDKKTPICLTNHSFFNIDGLGGNVLDQSLKLYADRYTAVQDLIPTGERPSVLGTQFDFTYMHKIGDRIFDNIPGYDHNYIISKGAYGEFLGKQLPLAAEVENGKLRLSFYTTEPCFQFYSGIYLGDGGCFKGNKKIVKCGAFCLEAQTEPNCIQRGEAIYDAGEPYTQTTVYKVEKI